MEMFPILDNNLMADLLKNGKIKQLLLQNPLFYR